MEKGSSNTTAPSSSSTKNAAKKQKSSSRSIAKAVARDIPVDAGLIKKYARGSTKIKTKNIRHKNLRKTLMEAQDNIIETAVKNASTEILLPAETGFIESEEKKVFKIKQVELRERLDMNTARNMFDLHLTKFGPYKTKYSRNGRYMIFGGKKGHVAVMDCQKTTVGTELQLQESVYDVQYLHNETMFAVAQNKYVYIYDYKGVEIHCMKKHERPYALDFLPYHFLLNTAGHSGWVKWHDISTGEYVAGCVSTYPKPNTYLLYTHNM